jgi:hypothetical protein
VVVVVAVLAVPTGPAGDAVIEDAAAGGATALGATAPAATCGSGATNSERTTTAGEDAPLGMSALPLSGNSLGNTSPTYRETIKRAHSPPHTHTHNTQHPAPQQRTMNARFAPNATAARVVADPIPACLQRVCTPIESPRASVRASWHLRNNEAHSENEVSTKCTVSIHERGKKYSQAYMRRSNEDPNPVITLHGRLRRKPVCCRRFSYARARRVLSRFVETVSTLRLPCVIANG